LPNAIVSGGLMTRRQLADHSLLIALVFKHTDGNGVDMCKHMGVCLLLWILFSIKAIATRN